MDELLDFLYLDIPRLSSFASQLFEGLPATSTKLDQHETEFSGGVDGGLPLILRARGDTKAVMSASSSVTSNVHHELVSRVLSSLRDRQLLHEESRQFDTLADGSFVLVSGQLQIVDPRGLASTIRLVGPLQQALTKMTAGPEPNVGEGAHMPTHEAKRQARMAAASQTAEKARLDSFADVTEGLGGQTVRVRVVHNQETVGTAVVERDKFVEDLDRLVQRHGYLTGGVWRVLGQANMPASDEYAEPGAEGFLNLIEKFGVEALEQFRALSTGESGVALTPLAIYRAIPATQPSTSKIEASSLGTRLSIGRSNDSAEDLLEGGRET